MRSPWRKALAALPLLLFTALAPVSATAFAPLEGDFIARDACPAWHSLARRDNPGAIRLVPEEAYAVEGLNRADGDYVRLRIPDAEPRQRWVARTCGVIEAQRDGEDDGDGFAPIFGADLPRPRLGAFDEAVLALCGGWGSRPAQAGFRALFDDAAHTDAAERIGTALGYSLLDRRLAPEAFFDALTEIWFAQEGFRHIFCGEPSEEGLGGLHFRGRILQLEEEGWGGLAACDRATHAPPLASIGIRFRTPSGARAEACPKSFLTDRDALGLLIEVTRAFTIKKAHEIDERMCLHALDQPRDADESSADLAVLVTRDRAIRTFYPTASPRCDGGAPPENCLCMR
ncbi:MAG: hypothetical protein JJU21_02965 [Salinarimonas sp.]|nr:hypothetical protein [Salinarimonas sp.]